VALWQSDKHGAVSMTFDGGELSSQYNNAFPLLQQRGLKATFFTFSYDPDVDAVLSLAADGQEIGSNGIDDWSLTDLTPAWQDHFLEWSQLDLQELLWESGYAEQDVSVFAYPRGVYNADIIAKTTAYYIAARTADTANPAALNGPTLSLSPNWFYQLAVIAPNDNGNDDPNVIAYLRGSVELAVAENKWAIEQFHDIGAGGYETVSTAAFGAHLDYLAGNEPNVWVAPLGSVCEYIRQRDTALITTLVQDSNTMQLDLHCGLDPNIFNTPLTLLTDYPLEWPYGQVQVRQGTTEQIAEIVYRDGSWYMMYDAVPDRGTVELSVTPLEPDIDFIVTASADENGTINPAGDVTAAWDSDPIFTAIPDPNHDVDQWFVDGLVVQSGGSTYRLTQIRADHMIEVTFKPYSVTVADWQGGKKCAVSITFDDGLISQYQNAFALLQQHGLKATFFIVSDYMGYPAYIDQWHLAEYAADGQEIGSHSYSHPFLTEWPAWFQQSELAWSQSDLQDFLWNSGYTEQDVSVFAYPYGDYDANVINLTEDYYIAARGAGSWFNPETGSISLNGKSPNFYELAPIGPHDNGDGDPNAVAYLNYAVDRAVAKNRWAIEMIHDVDAPGGYDNISAAALETHLAYLAASEANVWAAPMGTVSEYIYERNAASVTMLYSDNYVIRLDLHCGLGNRFNTPLTLLSVCPHGWESRDIYVKQGQTEQLVEIVLRNGIPYMMYNAIPDAGIIELSPAPLVITAAPGANGTMDPAGEVMVPYGSDQVFTAAADMGYEVDQWWVDGLLAQIGQTEYTLSAITTQHTIAVTFKPFMYTLIVSAGDHGAIDPFGELIIPYSSGQVFTATADEGYEVDKWFVDGGEVQSGGTDYTLNTITTGHTVTVTFKLRTYIITASAGANGSIDPSGEIIKEHGSSQTFTAAADTGYEVDTWVVDSNDVQAGGTDYTLSAITANHTATVTFKLLTYTVSASSGANGSLDLIGDIIKEYGSSQVFTATADEGYEVDKWLVDSIGVQAGGTDYTLSAITAGHTVAVTFKLRVYTINASAGINGSIDPSGDILKEHGSIQTFTAAADEGFEVDKWVVDSNNVQTGGTDYTLSAITANHTVAVTFKLRVYTINASAGINGSIDPSGDILKEHGSSQTFTAAADEGFEVDTWVVDSNDVQAGGTDYTLSAITGGHTVAVTFKPLTYTISASAGINGSIDPSGDILKEHGSSQVFTASADEGYEVDKWVVDSNDVQAGGTDYTLSAITANHTVAVTFKPLTYTISASAGSNGSIDPSGDIIREHGSSQTFTAAADEGFEVDTWVVDSNDVQAGGTDYTLSAITANHTVAVTFKLQAYTIWGYCIEPDGDTPVEGVLIQTDTLNNAVTDANGFYELRVDHGWTGIVTPQKDGYIFDPNSDEYIDVIQDYMNANYIAELRTFKITGHIREQDLITPISDVNVIAENGGGAWTTKYESGPCVSDANGFYELTVDYNWSGIVMPSKYAYAFEPDYIEYATVLTDQNDQDYLGELMTYAISGYIRNACGTPITRVPIAADNGGGSDITDPNGFYELWVSYNWSGFVIPGDKANYTFDPAAAMYTGVLSDQPEQDYLAENRYDLDCDGLIGYGDVCLFASDWLNGPDRPSDFYKDESNSVNLRDFADFANVWLTQ
jgi:peptidoglycan/xylan/chitin deacetylase (PgdA/CDA1 family)